MYSALGQWCFRVFGIDGCGDGVLGRSSTAVPGIVDAHGCDRVRVSDAADPEHRGGDGVGFAGTCIGVG